MPGVGEVMNGAGSLHLESILERIYDACQHSERITKFKSLHSLTFLDEVTLYQVGSINNKTGTVLSCGNGLKRGKPL